MAQTAALAVSVELGGALGIEVAAFVENEAGWQLVAPDGPPTPLLSLGATIRPDVPSVVVVASPASVEQVRRGLRDGAIDVIGWPDDRGRLLHLPGQLRASPAVLADPGVVAVGGVAGGVGTSTVALAVGGLLAWAGRRTLVLGGPDLLALCGVAWRGPAARELAALEPAAAAVELPALAVPVAGMERLSVLAAEAGAVDVRGWPVDVVVHDRRDVGLQPAAAARLGVLVAKPDAALRRAAAAPRNARVLVVGDGPLDPAGVRRTLRGRSWSRLPQSARVARAGLLGRVPSSLPGSWLRVLRAFLAGVRS